MKKRQLQVLAIFFTVGALPPLLADSGLNIAIPTGSEMVSSLVPQSGPRKFVPKAERAANKAADKDCFNIIKKSGPFEVMSVHCPSVYVNPLDASQRSLAPINPGFEMMSMGFR